MPELTDFAISVDVGSVNFFEFFHQRSQCVLCQFQLLFERLNPVVDRIGFAIVAVIRPVCTISQRTPIFRLDLLSHLQINNRNCRPVQMM